MGNSHKNSNKSIIVDNCEIINNCIMYKSNDYIKLFIMGDCKTGKSQITNRLCNIDYDDQYFKTYVFDFNKVLMQHFNKNILLNIMDLSGNIKSTTIHSLTHDKDKIIFFVFDLTNKESFDNIITWNQIYEQEDNNKSLKILIGNKCDLQNTCISFDEIKKLSNILDSAYFEVSAKDNIGFSDILKYLNFNINVVDP
ncbi:MAG: GTP-binding protein [Rickettsia endosymbiont of Ixodes persulcatus]|nr:GTP-binding protein [Rickettsia endosymbiont of Ixodes persulcatus]